MRMNAPVVTTQGELDDESRSAARLSRATTYHEWTLAAQAQDERLGGAKWRRTDKSSLYDYRVIRRRLEEIRTVRATDDPHQLLFYLNEGIHGNMGGMGNPALYNRARFGTKDLITHYITELAEALRQVAAAPETEVSLQEKLEFFRRASHCFGRSALMLSGAGALGPFHLGVVKALLEQGLLPDVISGASAGSMIAAFLGTHDDESLAQLFEAAALVSEFDDFSASARKAAIGTRISVDHVRGTVENLIPDLTFEEAFEKTGRKINISVSPRQFHQQSRLLNAITSPNVYIREAVLASCAIPGIFPPVTLAAKNRNGQRQPYVPSRKWVDGSMTDDMPIRRLTRLYGVNHFISSQTNPMILWALRDHHQEDNLFTRSLHIYQTAVKELYRATYPLAMSMVANYYPLNVMTRMVYGLATQDYTADINILPRRRFFNPAKLLSVLDEAETRELIHAGEAATWPKIEMIRNCTRISRTLDQLLAPMEQAIVHGALHQQEPAL
jgi:TAG lipase/steryl ester hydrolase/phospholipase A2/LPA acyltransferase